MTTIFSTKKTLQNRFSKRILGMESLENREMLSHPSGADYTPDYVQTATLQNFPTEDDSTIASSKPIQENDTIIFTLEEGEIPGEIAVTGGTTVTGLTSTAATITLPKVKDAKFYDVTVKKDGESSPVYTATNLTKNQIVLTGLTEKTKYDITVTFKDRDKDVLDEHDEKDLGSFTTWAADENAAAVKNPAINGGIAASYATRGKDFDGTKIESAGIKVTWKAPANYTGAYTVQIQQVDEDGKTVGNSGTKTIPAGSKAEAFIVAADGTGFTLSQNAYYKVKVIAGDSTSATAVIAPEVVVATGSNKIENYNSVGTATQAQSVTLEAITDSAKGFAVKATIAPASSPTNTIGYWVALYTGESAPANTFSPTDDKIKHLAYVANSGITGSVVEFGGLTVGTTYKAMAWAVNADGKANDSSPVKDDTGVKAVVPTGGTGSPTATYAPDTTYAGNLKATAGTGTSATSTELTWTNTQDEDDEAVTTIVGWQISYSIDSGKNWILSQHVAANADKATVTGLNLAKVKYQFKVQAIVKDATQTENDDFGLDKGATVTASKANVTLAKVASVNITASDQGTDKVVAKWVAVTGASAYLVTVQDAKGIVHQGIVATNAFDSSAVTGLKLVPGITYNISVITVAYNGTEVVKAAAAKGSATTVKFSEPNLKIAQDKKVALTSVELAIDEKVTTAPASTTRAYVIEYTYIADAKGKADWSTATVLDVTTTNFELEKLKAGTQYYARLVAYDSTDGKTTADSDKISIGKEFKFKTVAAPLATITKPAFALEGNDLVLKFTGKVPVDKTGDAAVLTSGTKFYYELIVSTDAVIDKVTGKLANGKSFTTTALALEADEDDVFKQPITQALTGDNGVFATLNAGLLDPASFKALNFQLLVYYVPSSASSAENAYATAYTKVAKLALPKWFV